MQAIIFALVISSFLGSTIGNPLSQTRAVFPTKEQEADIAAVRTKLAHYRKTYLNSNSYKELLQKTDSFKDIPRAPEYDKVGDRPHSLDQLNAHLLDELYQGDIRLTSEQADIILNEATRTKRQAFRDSRYPTTIWQTGVPYEFDRSLDAATVNLIRSAVQFWQNNTCITFTENGAGPQRIIFFKGSGCWSYIGRITQWSSQQVSIGEGCENETTATNNNYNVMYDYGSVMHYDDESFAINRAIPVLVAANSNFQRTMGSRIAPSFDDVKVMNAHYGCNTCQASVVCDRGGYIDPRTCDRCKCALGFAGDHCTDRQPASNGSATCGATVAASTNWQTLGGSVGDFVQVVRSVMTSCFWHITSPSGTVIEVRRMFVGRVCSSGCFYGGIEINVGSDFRQTGYRYCCPTDYDGTPTVTSASNLVMIMAYNSYYASEFNVQYRYVNAPA